VSDEVRQPNDIDRRRIMRLLQKRSRYQYVSPQVLPAPDGYRVVSPCCSRNIDRAGGPIDIARFEFSRVTRLWTLYRKDHEQDAWREYACGARLDELMDYLNDDPEKIFWQ
jgi:hypothetical protein